jgi:hypothetical protein
VADQESISEPHGRRPEPLVARLYDPGPQSREELRAYGRQLRSRTPRSSHGVWAAASGRPAPLQVLRQQDDERLPELLPRRYGRLLAGHTDYARHGQRLVTGQRLTQAVSGLLLGWSRSEGGDRYVRHLRDTEVPRERQPHAAWSAGWARLCGATLARAHARSVDPAVLSGYMGGSDRFDTAIAAFAVAHAARNERDFEVLEAAVRAGRVPAERDL